MWFSEPVCQEKLGAGGLVCSLEEHPRIRKPCPTFACDQQECFRVHKLLVNFALQRYVRKNDRGFHPRCLTRRAAPTLNGRGYRILDAGRGFAAPKLPKTKNCYRCLGRGSVYYRSMSLLQQRLPPLPQLLASAAAAAATAPRQFAKTHISPVVCYFCGRARPCPLKQAVSKITNKLKPICSADELALVKIARGILDRSHGSRVRGANKGRMLSGFLRPPRIRAFSEWVPDP